MNKNIKHILLVLLVISSYSVIEPVKYINLTNSKVNAETTSFYLKNLSMSDADIDFDSDKTYYSVNVDDSVNEVKITAKPKSDDAEVQINGDVVDLSDKYRKLVDLDDGENVIKIEVVNNEGKSKTYTLIVTRGNSNSAEVYLSGIKLNNGIINFQKETKSYDINVKSNIDKINIKATPEDKNNTITIDGSPVTEDDGYEQTVYLDKGKNEIIVQVENKKEKKRSYKLNITREDDSNGIQAQDNIYLDFIKLSDAELNITKAETLYNVKVKETVELISIHAEPENNKYMVEINGDAVEESEDYTKDDVRLHEGKNEIKIKIEDLSGKKRTYVLNIYRGEMPANVNDVSNTGSKNGEATKINQWVQKNNNWQYNDATGQPLKNTWFYDRNAGRSYYLKADGNMSTGWLNLNGSWYYLNVSGARQSGWQLINNEWYYFDSEGKMKTGWILDNSKYYYLQVNGSMAKSATIKGYKLGADGAWIK